MPEQNSGSGRPRCRPSKSGHLLDVDSWTAMAAAGFDMSDETMEVADELEMVRIGAAVDFMTHDCPARDEVRKIFPGAGHVVVSHRALAQLPDSSAIAGALQNAALALSMAGQMRTAFYDTVYRNNGKVYHVAHLGVVEVDKPGGEKSVIILCAESLREHLQLAGVLPPEEPNGTNGK